MLRIIRRSLAGHSKWANIRHKKGGKDAAKADQFQKLAGVAPEEYALEVARAKDGETKDVTSEPAGAR